MTDAQASEPRPAPTGNPLESIVLLAHEGLSPRAREWAEQVDALPVSSQVVVVCSVNAAVTVAPSPRVLVVPLPSSGTPPTLEAARRAGTEHAAGDVIRFLDAAVFDHEPAEPPPAGIADRLVRARVARPVP